MSHNNRSGEIGTAFAAAVVKAIRINGFGTADRRVQKGRNDEGDLTGTPGIAWECKGGDAARYASDGQIEKWLTETEKERQAAGAVIGVLVVARWRHRAEESWAIIPSDTLAALWIATDPSVTITPGLPIRLELAHLCTLLRGAGYGDPLDAPVSA